MVVMLGAASVATAQDSRRAPSDEEIAGGALARLSHVASTLVGRVARSVVQVVATVYRPVDPGSPASPVARGRSVGSGVIVDASGYVMTNAHVVAGATAVELVLESDGAAAPQVAWASVEGVAPELDLALLRVPLTGLPAVTLADSTRVRQGDLVFALGSPDGLRNSVSMGVVSAVARQANPDVPLPYIQTDAAVNPGQSGGALVNTEGALLGINTFIRSASGGSEGLSFAVPSAVVAHVFPALRDCGYLQRAVTGISVQAVTPRLRSGLALTVSSGLLVANVLEGSPAAGAGIQVGDVITAIDGRRTDSAAGVPELYLHLLTLQDGQSIALRVSRAGEDREVNVRAAGVPRGCPSRPVLSDLDAMRIDGLGVLATPLSHEEARTAGRLTGGVLVGARLDTRAETPPLAVGDIVHAVNGTVVATVEEARAALAAGRSAAGVVLQVDRGGQFAFVEYGPEP